VSLAPGQSPRGGMTAALGGAAVLLGQCHSAQPCRNVELMLSVLRTLRREADQSYANRPLEV